MTSDRQSALIWVEATPNEQHVDPGDRAVFAINVENRSSSAQSQTVRVDGIPPEWVQINFDTRGRAFPQERRNGTITVTVPEDAEPGVRDIAIVASGGGEESRAAAVLDILALAPVPLEPGIALAPETLELTAGSDEQRIRVNVRNVGSQEAEYALTFRGVPDGWYRMTESMRLQPGAAGEAEVWLRVPATADEQSHRFVVRVAVAEAPEVYSERSGELRVKALEQSEEPPTPRPPTPPPTPPTPPQPPPPPPPPVTPVDDESGVLAPDVLLAPSTSFRFGEGDVSLQAMVTIQNRSRITERYLLFIEGLPDRWFTLTADDVSLEPQESQQVPLRLSPRPGPEHPAGEYHFRVRVVPHGYPTAATEVPAVLNVAGVETFETRIDPPQATGRTVEYQLTYRNTGTRPVELETDGSDPEERVKFRILPPPSIEAGREAALPVSVGAKRNRFVGSPETFDFQLRTAPPGTSVEGDILDARFIHKPFVTWRVPGLVLFYLVLALLVAFLFFWAPGPVEALFENIGCRIDSNGQECAEDGEVVAPLESNVVNVLHRPGDEVAEGDTVMVVDTGDEELEVNMPEDGRIVSIDADGGPVARGDRLFTYQPLEDATTAATVTPTGTPEPTATTPGTTTPETPTPDPTATPASVAATCENDPGTTSAVVGLADGVAALAADELRIRSDPGTDGNILVTLRQRDVPASDQDAVLELRIVGDSPTCGDGLVWWQVESVYYGVQGWSAEATSEETLIFLDD